MDGDGNGASGKDRDERDESGEKQDNLRVTKTGRVSFFIMSLNVLVDQRQ